MWIYDDAMQTCWRDKVTLVFGERDIVETVRGFFGSEADRRMGIV
jgi:hypothetical protein